MSLLSWLKARLALFQRNVPDEANSVDEAPPIASSFVQTGRLTRASKIRGIFSRYHSRKWLFEGDQFYKNFEDSERKWNSNDRYAASGLTCGHFFGCSRAATEVEAAFYGLSTKGCALLEVEMILDGLLDLTYEENIDWVLSCVFENPELLGRSYFVKLIELIHHQRGGDEVNALIGHVARREGYDGIIFFGARALREYEGLWMLNPEDPLIHDTEEMAFPLMRGNRDIQNIVVFPGSLLTRSIERYRIDGGEWKENRFFGMAGEKLDNVLQYPSSFQAERRRLIVVGKIRLETAERGKEELTVFDNPKRSS